MSVFWGKADLDRETGKPLQLLPLTVHCVDVAWVFRKLAAIPSIRKRLQSACDPANSVILDDIQLDRLAIMALLHDVGKANLGFQNKIFSTEAPRAGHIRELAPLFVDAGLQAKIAESLQIENLCHWFDPPDALVFFLLAAWSHHGTPQKFDPADQTGRHYYLAKTKWWQIEGARDPFLAVAELMTTAKDAFPSAFSIGGDPIQSWPRLQHRFAGLLMLADWIGSHRTFFPLDRTCEDALKDSAGRAEAALKKIGLNPLSWQDFLSSHIGSFDELFGFSPRPLQSELQDAPVDATNARLIIAEAETGSGKTEAALLWFLRLFSAHQVDALYFALPTRVAARELYSRIHRYIDRIFPATDIRPSVLLAVPGYARVDDILVDGMLPEDTTRWHDDDRQIWQERAWAAENPKRFLAAPIAVGTIDQALLSALQVRHAHLRSVCLDRSLLVVDEVHASDPYMRRLLHDLLDHHLSMGGFALLLSATLGSRARAAFTGRPEPSFLEACDTPYPALTDKSGIPRAPAAKASPWQQKDVIVQLLSCMEQPMQVLPEVSSAISCGARILIVLNIVDRAIALHRASESYPDIESALLRCHGVRAPHHGRFAAADREVLDRAVTESLGKDSREGSCLLIGTQTLEQSLDIDADLLITDLCPMDVLLQRIGRLHRHDRKRPKGFEKPRCVVLCPRQESLDSWLTQQGDACGTAKKLGLGSVYPDMRVLQLTFQLLAEHSRLHLPRQNRLLVEGATHAERLACLQGECWMKHGQRVEGTQVAQEVRAEYAAISDLYEKSFGDFQFHEIGSEAKTRLGLNTLRVPLDRTVRSPFGQSLTEVTIPGHMAPENPPESPARVLDTNLSGITIEYGNRHYFYSRHGLEKLDEPAR
jgi:CRISPR-associated endonuclease/helicase Cas3